MNRVILGASDAEMRAIEALARGVGVKVAWATLRGGRQRVAPATAYDAAHPQPQSGDVWVECRPAGYSREDLEQLGVVVIDHHCFGDYGFTRSAEDFLRGSSIGQFLRELARSGYLAGQTETLPADIAVEPGLTWFDGENWWVASGPVVVRVPEEILLLAAADHCLAAAYAGRCPGVDPEHLWVARLEQIALQYNCEVDLLETEWSEQVSVICAEAPKFRFDGIEVLDLRRWPRSRIAEPLARAGIPYLFETGGMPAIKGDSTGEAVEAFCSWAARQGWETYGSPERGFAGIK